MVRFSFLNTNRSDLMSDECILTRKSIENLIDVLQLVLENSLNVHAKIRITNEKISVTPHCEPFEIKL